jgi:hypothetical protein
MTSFSLCARIGSSVLASTPQVFLVSSCPTRAYGQALGVDRVVRALGLGQKKMQL